MRPDILIAAGRSIAAGRLLSEIEPSGPRRDVGLKLPLGDLFLKAIDVKLPSTRSLEGRFPVGGGLAR